MVFTSRLTASLGIKQALFITPIGMLVLAGIIVAVGNLTSQEKLIFYLFGICSMVVDVLRTSFNSPVLLTLMQPLPTYERLRAHNIVKGIMDPFASFLSGSFLLILFYMHDKVDLMFLCYVLVILGILWLIGVVLVNRQYLQILINTISSRYFSRDEFNLNDDSVKQLISDKIRTGTDLEVISILRMLTSKKDPASEELIGQLIYHPSQQVKLEALRLIDHRTTENVKLKLKELLQSNSNGEVKQEAVRTFCKISSNDQDLSLYRENENPAVRTAAVTGMLGNRDTGIRKEAETAIRNLLVSGEKGDKEKAISILDAVKDEYDPPDHVLLINDTEPATRIAAINAVGKAACRETLMALVDHITANEKAVLAAFYDAGNSALPVVKEQVFSAYISSILREKLIGLCGRIGGEEARQLLLELLDRLPAI